ncbi:MAG: hypothetical protein KDD43_08305 [Bdellovibrionales bacterium]|nr:hypothetical protein [Bdellovibrionales bacterium]
MMARRLALVAVFVLASIIEVRVNAAKNDHKKSLVHSGPVAEPPDCVVQNSFPCAVQISSKKHWLWTWPQGRVEFSPGTVVILKSPGDLKIVRGELILYSTSGGAWLRTLFGDVAVSDGILLVRREEDEGAVEITTLRGEAQIFPKGGKENLFVPAGYRNWLGAVEANGEAGSGIPQAANKERCLKVWAELFRGEKPDFFSFANDFHSSWMRAVESAGDLHRELIARTIASMEAERAEQARLREIRERESRKLRALFRRKNYLE